MSTRSKIVLSLLIVLLLSLVSVLMVVYFGKENIDMAPKEEGSIQLDYSKSVNLVDGEEVLNKLGNYIAYDKLREDLHYFAKDHYEVYKTNANKVVGFKVNSKSVKQNDNKLEFKGNYGSVTQDINVSIEILNNNNIKVSITDSKDKYNIDDKLPSNSKVEQFIGSLPYISTEFSVSYSKKEYKIIVKLTSIIYKDSAIKYLKSKLDENDINDSKVNILYPYEAVGSSRVEYRQVLIN